MTPEQIPHIDDAADRLAELLSGDYALVPKKSLEQSRRANRQGQLVVVFIACIAMFFMADLNFLTQHRLQDTQSQLGTLSADGSCRSQAAQAESFAFDDLLIAIATQPRDQAQVQKAIDDLKVARAYRLNVIQNGCPSPTTTTTTEATTP